MWTRGDSTRSNNRRRSRSGHLTVLSGPKWRETGTFHLLETFSDGPVDVADRISRRLADIASPQMYPS